VSCGQRLLQLDRVGQVEVAGRGPDLAPDSLLDVIIEITQYIAGWPGVHPLRRHATGLLERPEMQYARRRSWSARGNGWPRSARRARIRVRR
jgi:hypothetical protein